MSVAGRFKAAIGAWLTLLDRDSRVVRKLGWKPHGVRHDDSIPLPPGAQQVLRPDNPDLIRWRELYATLDLPVCRHTFWDRRMLARDVNLPWFRGDNAYVWQLRQLGGDAAEKMEAVLHYVESRDRLGLLARCHEDGLFGCWTFSFGHRGTVSRDLLDSVNEINFLERHLHLSKRTSLRIADIGAGYGRLAHRFCAAFASVQRYDCFDAVPESTFLCDYYLRFRGIADRARAIPLTDAAATLAANRYDLAVNIHSFPECTYDAVAWWLARLHEARVPWLLIVPNHAARLDTAELDGTKRDFAPLLGEMGFELVAQEPVLADPQVRARVGVDDQFMLYRRP